MNIAKRFQGGLGLKGWVAGQHLIENRPQAVNVRGGAQPFHLAGSLFWRHVAGRAHNQAGIGQPAVRLETLGQAEIGDIRFALGVEQDIGGFQVAVQNAALMGEVDGSSDICQQGGGFAGPLFEIRDFGREVAPLDKLHHEIMMAFVLIDIINGNDIAVFEAGGGFGFRAEALDIER